MSTETIVTSGLADLERFLNELPEKLQVNIARAAMAAGARIIRDEAKLIVPVKSGALRQSIRVSTRREKSGAVVATIRAGGKNRKGDAFYAHFVEYGTSAHRIQPKKSGAKVLKIGAKFVMIANQPGARAKPFMRPALDHKAEDAILQVAKSMALKISDLKK